MTRPGRTLELLVKHLEEVLAQTSVKVTSPDLIMGAKSKTQREVDVSIRGVFGTSELLIILECRDRSKPQDVRWIEEIASKIEDVAANKAIAISPTGFSEAAQNVAQAYGIALRTFDDVTDSEIFDWLGDFRIEYVRRFAAIADISLGLAGQDMNLLTDQAGLLTEFFKDPDAFSAPILIRGQDGPSTSFMNLWESFAKTPEFETLWPTRGEVDRRIRLRFPPNQPHYVKTAHELIAVDQVLLTCKLTVEVQIIPASKVYKYTEGQRDLAHNADYEFKHDGSARIIGIHMAPDGNKGILTLRVPSEARKKP